MTSRAEKPEDMDFGDLNKLWKEIFHPEFVGNYVSVEGVRLPDHFNKFRDEIENFKIRDDDVWICSFPKGGKCSH